MTGLSSESAAEDCDDINELSLSCDMRCGGQIINGIYNVVSNYMVLLFLALTSCSNYIAPSPGYPSFSVSH
jgi:hypothetical protein